jgi:outer membrane protein OmpA-like peptidoglycan-associated protein
LIAAPAEFGTVLPGLAAPIQLRIRPPLKEQNMKTKIIALAVSALVAGSVQAAPKDERNREEGIGVGAGSVVGAIAGGPIGFVVGAAMGGWLGNKFHGERSARTEAEERFAEAEARYERAEALASSLEEVVAGSEGELEELKLVMTRQENAFRDALREAFDVEVYFHTGEAALPASVARRVERLGEILSDFEDFPVVIEGHADPRGDDTYNEQLSAERAAAVREALIRSGLASDKITTRAAGERLSRAADDDLDAMALERRVDLSIIYPLPRDNRVASK